MIDYSKLTNNQLLECLNGIDSEAFPENYRNLITEINARGIKKSGDSAYSELKSKIRNYLFFDFWKSSSNKWQYPDICEKVEDRLKRHIQQTVHLHIIFALSIILVYAASTGLSTKAILAIIILYCFYAVSRLRHSLKESDFTRGTIIREGAWTSFAGSSTSIFSYVEFNSSRGILRFYKPFSIRATPGSECLIELNNAGMVLGYRILTLNES